MRTFIGLATVALAIIFLAGFASASSSAAGNGHHNNGRGEYCSDSAFDAKMTSLAAFQRQRGLFLTAFELFANATTGANLTDTDVLLTLATDLQARAVAFRQVEPKVHSFTVTRSSGIIIIDSASSPSVNPALENHNTRYEFAKAIQCRDHGAPIVFEKYFVPRIGGHFQFFAKAIETANVMALAKNWKCPPMRGTNIQTGIDGTWFVFRINVFSN